MTNVEQKRGVLARVAIAIVLFKVLVLAFAAASPWLLPGRFDQDAYYGNFHWPPQEPPSTLAPLATWDAQHYLFLAAEGYGPGRWPIAFFPLFPWLIRAVAALPGIGPLGAALLVANVLSIAACLLLYRFVDRRYPGAAPATIVLLLAFPGALFFHFPYTESLFLFLAVATVVAVAEERFLLAAAPAFLLALTRPNGVLIGIALLYAAASRWRRERKLEAAPLIALAAPALGFAVYLLFMRATTGDAFAGFEMQRAFNAGRSFASFLDPLSALRGLVDVAAFHDVLHSFLDRAVFVFVLATLVPLWRLDRTLFWYVLPMALVGPLSGSFVSYTRFAAVLFPCHLMAARALSRGRGRPMLWIVVAVWLAVQIFLLVRYVTFGWAG